MKDREYIKKVFPYLYTMRWESQGKTQEQFAEAIKKIQPESGINKTYVSRLLNGKYAPRPYLLQAICKVLDVEMSEFEPKTHEDKYQYSSAYADGLEKRLEILAEKNFGIDLTFFQGLRNIIPDFDSIYPTYCPLGFRAYDSNGEYYKRLVPAESAETKNGKGLLQIEKDGKTSFLTKNDMKIIKRLQDIIKEAVINWFEEVGEQLKKAEAEAVQTYIDKNSDIWVRNVLSNEELQHIDPLGIYTDEERDKWKLPPEGTPIYTEGMPLDKETEV